MNKLKEILLKVFSRFTKSKAHRMPKIEIVSASEIDPTLLDDIESQLLQDAFDDGSTRGL